MSKCLLIMHSSSGCKVKKVTAIGGPPGIVGEKKQILVILNSVMRKYLATVTGNSYGTVQAHFCHRYHRLIMLGVYTRMT